MFYEAVFRSLEQHHVIYVIVGGMAVNLHGIPRLTADLDIVVDLEVENLKRLLSALKEVEYVPRLPVKPEDLLSAENREIWYREKNLRAFTFWNQKLTFQQIDLLFEESKDSKIFENAKKISLGSMKIRIASIDDLIAMKEKAGRNQDKSDIESLQKLKSME